MKLKNRKIIIAISSIIIILIIITFTIIKVKNKDEDKGISIINDEYTRIDKNQLSYKDNVTVDELKESVGLTANSDIYEIQEEFDGRKILTVKADLKYKVAFAGMIKKRLPTMDELDKILQDNLPKYNGIWVEKDTRNKLLEILNGNKFNSKYSIDNNGYIKIDEKNNQNDLDKKIEKTIKGDKQYILDISSVCYIVDDVTGEIMDYNFENLDRYQTYECFEDNNKIIVFISQNTKGIYTDEEIIESVIDLL